MIEKLVAFEERLTRVEAALLVGVVVFMLLLAVYNVFYRNALIPLQIWVVEEATVEVEVPIEPPPESAEPSSASAEEPEADGFGGGFGGGFGEPESDESGDSDGFGGGFGAADEPDEEDGFGGGFGGGFGDEESPEPDRETTETDDAPAEEPDDADGFGGGFGGGFGDESDTEDESADGFGGGFGEADGDATGSGEEATAEPEPTTRTELRGPEDGSFARWVSDAIDAVKLEWSDVLLRQLVLVIGFLGSMLATRRRKHITVDALSKILPIGVLPWVQVVTNLLSIAVCVLLTVAGWGLVEIGLEFPKELTWFAEEWVFQLVFPIGFGLLTFHFGVRLVESVAWGMTGEPVGTIVLEERPIAASATAGDVEPVEPSAEERS